MQTLSKYLTGEPAPLYVRWSPERSHFTIELKLELVRRISEEIERNSEGEIGGILIGSLPADGEPVLRVSDIQLLKPSPNAAKVFLLDPREHDRFVAARWQANERGRMLVGLFRSHQRSGPMRPSLADRTLLAGEFDTRAYVLLLVSAHELHTAAFFVGSNGELAQEPSVNEFRFDDESLKALPEIAGAPPPAQAAVIAEVEPAPKRRVGPYAAGVFLVAATAAALYAWSGVPINPASSPGLQVAGNGLIQITWDRSSAPVLHAAAGRLTIIDGDQRRELKILQDELRSGTVEYQPSGPAVQVQLMLDMPGGYSVAQAVSWQK